MDSKEIKSQLKQAREAIRNKDYKTALKHCRDVLKADKDNYNALVFIGYAAQEMNELEQACSAFERAVQVAPDQLLAWQGYCNFYEKHGTEDTQTKLMMIYEKMLSLIDENDKERRLAVLAKLFALYKTLGRVEECARLAVLYVHLLKENTTRAQECWIPVTDILLKQAQLNTEQEQLLEDGYKQLFSSENRGSSAKNETLYGNYLLYLCKRGCTDKAIEESKKFMACHPDSLVPLELLCKMMVAKYIDDESVSDNEFNVGAVLLEKNPSSGIGRITLGVQFLIRKDYMKALEEINDGSASCPDFVEGWLLLSLVYLHLHSYTQAEESSLKGIKLSRGIDTLSSCKFLIGKLYLSYAKALIENNHFESAIEILKQCEKELGNHKSKEIFQLYFRYYLKQGDLKSAEELCSEFEKKMDEQDPQTLICRAELLLKRKQYLEAEKKLREVVLQREDSWGYHLLGVALWETEQYSKGHNMFLKAAKLDPYYYKNFVYLGHYYRKQKNDYNVSLKCYQRAFELNSSDEECGSAISDNLHDIGEEDANRKFLCEIIERNAINPPKWATVRFGLNHLMHGDPSTAIFAFQKALKSDLDDSNCWEYLGEAYYQQGSYDSALKAFRRTSELKPCDLYPIYKIANVRQMSGLYKEALQEYYNILKLQDDYIPALKGLAETLLFQGQTFMSQNLFGLGFNCLEEALEVLSRIIHTRPELSCVWKLLGDACLIPGLIGPKEFEMTFPSGLLTNSQSNTNKLKTIEILCYGTRFYKQAVSLQPEISGFWHDLGITLYLLSLRANDENIQKEEGQKAALAIKKALSLDPNNDKLWNSLGVVATLPVIKDYSVSQHCFIKSIQLVKNNAVAWTNLGLIYLINDNIKLANDAFGVAQSLDPSYHLCWVGQALIAESIEHHDTMDLFRHTTNLGNHPESLIGYAHWVCTTLLNTAIHETEHYKYNIVKMHAVAAASDALIKYTASVQTNPSAFSMLGMILERQGLYKGSLDAYKKALSLLEERNDVEATVEKVRINYARLLRNSGFVEEALSQYQKLKNFDSTVFCELALCLTKIGYSQKAYQAYAKALNNATSSEDKSHIQVAMAFIARELEGPNVAKRLLFESSQQDPPSVPGLQALCALGILEDDKTLTEAAVKALSSHLNNAKYRSGIVLLTTCLYLMKGDLKRARNQILNVIHQYPSEAYLWHQLSLHFLQLHQSGARFAAQFVQTAQLHGGDAIQLSYILAFSYLLCGCKKSAFKAAQKSIHLRPDLIHSWSSLLPNMDLVDDPNTALRIFEFVRMNGINVVDDEGLAKLILKWIILIEIHTHLQKKNYTSAGQIITMAKNYNLASDDETATKLALLESLHEILVDCSESSPPVDKHVKKIAVILMQNPSHSFAWMLFYNIFTAMGKVKEADETIQRWLALPAFENSRTKILPLLLLIVSLLHKTQKTKEEKDKWSTALKGFINEALKIDPQNKAVAFCSGVFGVKINNKGLARKGFNNVIKPDKYYEHCWMDKVARRVLLHFRTATEEGKEIPPKELLESAICAKDEEFINFYNQVYPTSEKDETKTES